MHIGNEMNKHKQAWPFQVVLLLKENTTFLYLVFLTIVIQAANRTETFQFFVHVCF